LLEPLKTGSGGATYAFQCDLQDHGGLCGGAAEEGATEGPGVRQSGATASPSRPAATAGTGAAQTHPIGPRP